jgi:hypothetical protein
LIFVRFATAAAALVYASERGLLALAVHVAVGVACGQHTAFGRVQCRRVLGSADTVVLETGVGRGRVARACQD